MGLHVFYCALVFDSKQKKKMVYAPAGTNKYKRKTIHMISYLAFFSIGSNSCKTCRRGNTRDFGDPCNFLSPFQNIGFTITHPACHSDDATCRIFSSRRPHCIALSASFLVPFHFAIALFSHAFYTPRPGSERMRTHRPVKFIVG